MRKKPVRLYVMACNFLGFRLLLYKVVRQCRSPSKIVEGNAHVLLRE